MDNTTSVRFNAPHYHKVREARKVAGLPVADLQIEIVDHPLIGKQICSKTTGKVYRVQKVYKEYYAGWFYKALLEIESLHSHGVRFIDNINCGDALILAQIDEFKREFKILEDE